MAMKTAPELSRLASFRLEFLNKRAKANRCYYVVETDVENGHDVYLLRRFFEGYRAGEWKFKGPSAAEDLSVTLTTLEIFSK